MQLYVNLLCFLSIQLSNQGDSAPHHSSLNLCLPAPCVTLLLACICCGLSPVWMYGMPRHCYILFRRRTGTFSILDTAQRSKASASLRSSVNIMLAFCSSPWSILQRQFYILVWIVYKTHLPGHKCLWLYLYSGIYGYGSWSALLKQDCKESR